MIKYLTIIVAAALILCGCAKELSQGDADFTVNVEKNTLALGDTAKFTFAGNPDILTFYSGELGKRYEYRDRSSADGTSLLTFRTARLSGGTQPNSLMLMITQDFAGVTASDVPATIQNISKASWTDISSRAVLATNPTSTLSGNIDLTDFANQNKPVYIAFKYNGQAGSIQNRWFIDQFSLKNVLPDGTSYEIANHNYANVAYTNYGVSTFSPGFVGYAVENTFNWNINASSLAINGAATVAAAANRSEAWAILGPINLKKVTPDVGEAIKAGSQKASAIKYNYKYPSRGKFNATFAGGSISIDDTRYVAKPVTITVN